MGINKNKIVAFAGHRYEWQSIGVEEKLLQVLKIFNKLSVGCFIEIYIIMNKIVILKNAQLTNIIKIFINTYKILGYYVIILLRRSKYMGFLYYILIPIISSILGGLIGGLFTYLGVKLTIKNENELKKQEIYEKNKEKNKIIIANRPQLEVVQGNDCEIEDELEIYVLPYIKPKLETEERIIFDYDKLDFNKNFWDCQETIIRNCGKCAIKTGFVQLEYKSGVNIYSKYELDSWKQVPWAKNYYSDNQYIPKWIYPNKCFKLKLFYPKKLQQLKAIRLNCYMSDEHENYWYQDIINLKVNGNFSKPISPDEYILHIRDGYYEWFIYDHLFYCKDVEKCFNTRNLEKALQKRKEKLWKQSRQNDKFKRDINTGNKLLNS